MDKTRRIFGSLLAVLLGVSSEAALANTPKVTVVQSVPVETALAQAELPHALDVWLSMIGRAKRSIDVAQMYLSSHPGEGIEKVIVALRQAGARGVEIRFLLSKNMIDEDPVALAAVREIPGVRVEVLDLKPHTGGILHAKYWIVDSSEVFVGSQNFDWRSLDQIHETGLLIEDEFLALKLKRIFDHDWEIATTGVRPSYAPFLYEPVGDVELFASPAALNPEGIEATLPKLLDSIRNAKHRLRIQLLEYSTTSHSSEGPWLEIDSALRAAAARGVKVQLLVSHWNTAKKSIDSLKSLSMVPNFEVRICTIPEGTRGFIPYARVIHTKQMVVDDRALWIGTSNWSRGYFYGTRNVEILVSRPDLARIGSRIFQTVWDQPYSEPIDPSRAYAEPRKGSEEPAAVEKKKSHLKNRSLWTR